MLRRIDPATWEICCASAYALGSGGTSSDSAHGRANLTKERPRSLPVDTGLDSRAVRRPGLLHDLGARSLSATSLAVAMRRVKAECGHLQWRRVETERCQPALRGVRFEAQKHGATVPATLMLWTDAHPFDLTPLVVDLDQAAHCYHEVSNFADEKLTSRGEVRSFYVV